VEAGMAEDVIAPSIDPATEPPVAVIVIPTLSIVAEVIKKIADDLPLQE
jgi:hypothetical protein